MIRLESKRDRTVLYLATSAAVLVLFLMGLQPLFESYRDISKKINVKNEELEKNKKLIKSSNDIYIPMLNIWKKSGISRPSDQANITTNRTISDAFTSLQLKDVQVTTQSTNVRSQKNRDFPQNVIRARGTGSYHQVLTLLWSLSKDENPLRVTEIDLTAKDDNPQFCTFSMLVSTTFYIPDTRKTGRASTAGLASAGSGSETSEVNHE
jgi:hypothetical protein